MKKILTVIAIICVISCNSKKVENNFSTLDSNTVKSGDSTDALLYLDNPQSDSFSIAVDSGSNQKLADTSMNGQ